MQTVIECRPDGAWDRLSMRVARLLRAVPGRAVWAILLTVCALAPAIAWLGPHAPRGDAPGAPGARAVEWPLRFDGRVLQPMALSPVEQRFADAFPGAIGRFTDGERLLVLRQVRQPTRMLHPAVDCYRGLGYRIEAARLERDAQQRLWRCFRAERGAGADATALRVCERIEDAGGEAYTDASAWFWAAALGRSTGPWQAVTVVSDMAHHVAADHATADHAAADRAAAAAAGMPAATQATATFDVDGRAATAGRAPAASL